MRSERLRWLVAAEGPFASVYFDDSHDTLDAVERREATWRDVRKHLESRDAKQELIDSLEEAVRDSRPAVGQRGRALIATGEQVLVNEHLIGPPPATVIRLSDYPYVVPLIDLEMRRPTYVFAAVDHTGADVKLYQGATISSTKIDGVGYPVHKPVTAGWNGYGDFQHTTEEAIRMNCRAVADHLTRLVDAADPEVVFVSGEVRSRTDLLSTLPQADLRIEAWAPTRDGCIRQAVLGTVESFLDLESAHAVHTRLRRLTADRDDDLLVAVLEEVIYLLDTVGETPVDLRLRDVDGGVDVTFATTDASTLVQVGAVPKAVSLNELRFSQGRHGWRCAVTLDV